MISEFSAFHRRIF